jgi:predicted small metal-binding protein
VTFILIIFPHSMAKLTCNDYGFECDFVAEGEMETVIDDFRKHTDDEHGIDYSKEAVMQFLLRKQGI